jgi:hypothetical protein
VRELVREAAAGIVRTLYHFGINAYGIDAVVPDDQPPGIETHRLSLVRPAHRTLWPGQKLIALFAF